MDRLITMATFMKVVDYRSFTAAAEDLGISRALVSRHVTDLEEHFGVRLLNRTTRSVAPSEAGARYYEICKHVLADLRTGENEIIALKDNIEGNISIVCPKWVGNFDISDAAVDFCIEYPEITIQLHVGEISLNPHEFLSRGFDVCIQPRRVRDSDVIVKKIGGIEYVLVATPEYLEARGEPAAIADLAGHDFLTKLNEAHWTFHDGSRVTLQQPVRFASNSYFTLCTAAARGLGIALIPRRVAEFDLREGYLHQVLPSQQLEDAPLYAAFAPGGNVPRKVRALISFLGTWFKKRELRGENRGGGTINIYHDARNTSTHPVS
ncbi:LysR family transcriptional regulator [Stakelama sp. CBK3Z-3]|uniref:LysR family transcriptional regulator n=1 Tax=Stakelama flava TaxID=2860338 RepID=A0ABS6XRT3_9SPHN|nr:LysR family transcriptional regulator [Stakelama flava]MBW4332131.1 LysR family transcriptional regulator [Stakelama flava]